MWVAQRLRGLSLHWGLDSRTNGGLAVVLRDCYNADVGDIAQLGERRVRIAEVGGSSPPISTCPCSSVG